MITSAETGAVAEALAKCQAEFRDVGAIRALIGPHGEIAEFIGPANYFGRPGVIIRRMVGAQAVPASFIGTEWRPAKGRVVTVSRETGRWVTPIERRLAIVDSNREQIAGLTAVQKEERC